MTSSPVRNVLFITLDQWRADCLSAVGHPCLRTPHIDALAAEGVLFRNHFSAASPCGPARAALLTGLYLHNHGSVRNGVPIRPGVTNIAVEAAKLGYEPALFGFTDTAIEDASGTVSYPAPLPGFTAGLHMPGDAWPWIDWLKTRGYQTPAAPRDMWLPRASRGGIADTPPVYTAEESETAFLTNRVIGFIEDAGSRPWFAHVSYFRPHHPYIAPEPYNRMYSPADGPKPVRAAERAREADQHPFLAALIERQADNLFLVQDKLPTRGLTEADAMQLRALYYGSVSECDAAIGRLVEALKRQGVYDDTLIVLTADHGDLLGDHWLWAAEGYFDAAFHVPLIVRDPSGARGAQVDAFTESVDVMPAILDRLGAEPPPGDGRSLSPWLSNETPQDWREEARFEFDFRDVGGSGLASDLGLSPTDARLSVVRGPRRKRVTFPTLPPLLFDLENDPGEFRNLAV